MVELWLGWGFDNYVEKELRKAHFILPHVPRIFTNEWSIGYAEQRPLWGPAEHRFSPVREGLRPSPYVIF